MYDNNNECWIDDDSDSDSETTSPTQFHKTFETLRFFYLTFYFIHTTLQQPSGGYIANDTLQHPHRTFYKTVQNIVYLSTAK